MYETLTGSHPCELSRKNIAELVSLVNKGYEFFWSRDEIRGYENGKRLGTGIPRKRNEYSTFGGTKISSGKSTKSNECSSG